MSKESVTVRVMVGERHTASLHVDWTARLSSFSTAFY